MFQSFLGPICTSTLKSQRLIKFILLNSCLFLGRYDLENQGNIGLWNMQKLGNALAPLINNSKHNQLVDVLKVNCCNCTAHVSLFSINYSIIMNLVLDLLLIRTMFGNNKQDPIMNLGLTYDTECS